MRGKSKHTGYGVRGDNSRWKETEVKAAKNWNMRNNETTANATIKDESHTQQ